MKQIVLILALMVGFHMISAAQESKEKTKVDGSTYKKKVEYDKNHHTAMYSPNSRKHYVVHHYARRRPVDRHLAYRRHVYHSYASHHRRYIHSKPVAHYKKVKVDNKKGEYKVKA